MASYSNLIKIEAQKDIEPSSHRSHEFIIKLPLEEERGSALIEQPKVEKDFERDRQYPVFTSFGEKPWKKNSAPNCAEYGSTNEYGGRSRESKVPPSRDSPDKFAGSVMNRPASKV